MTPASKLSNPGPLPDPLIRLWPDLLRLARHLTNHADQAQDLCQDVMLNLWTRLRAGEEISDLPAYARTALRNTYRQSLRDRRPGDELAEDMLVAEPQAYATLALAELDAAITRLPAAQADLIRMVAAGETSPADLARRTGLPKNTVMSRLARARAQLRAEMGIGSRAPVASLF